MLIAEFHEVSSRSHKGNEMKVLSLTINLVVFLLIVMQLFTFPVLANNQTLIDSVERAKLILEKSEKDIDNNMKSMASSCLYMSESLKELAILKAQFEEEQINDFAVGLPDAYELEIFDKELSEIKQRYKQANCLEPIVYNEQLRLLNKDIN